MTLASVSIRPNKGGTSFMPAVSLSRAFTGIARQHGTCTCILPLNLSLSKGANMSAASSHECIRSREGGINDRLSYGGILHLQTASSKEGLYHCGIGLSFRLAGFKHGRAEAIGNPWHLSIYQTPLPPLRLLLPLSDVDGGAHVTTPCHIAAKPHSFRRVCTSSSPAPCSAGCSDLG